MRKLFFMIFAAIVFFTSCDNLTRDELSNGVDTNNVIDEQTVNDNAVINDDAVTQDNSIIPDDSVDTDENNTPVKVSMTVLVSTTSYNGQYAPRNVFAVWIEKEDGSYVKSLGRWAQKYRSKLQRWYSKSGNGSQGMTDAITSASRMNHGNVPALVWTIDDIADQPSTDGIYNIYFELNETNGGSKTTTAKIQISETPQVLSTNNASNINNIQITFSN